MDRVVYTFMKQLNFWMVVGLSVLIADCQRGIVSEGIAADFLSRVNVLPLVWWKMIAVAVTSFGLLLLLLSIRCKNESFFVLKIGMEFLVSFLLAYALGFSYLEMIFLILADVVQYVPDWKRRIVYIVATCLFYLFMRSLAFEDLFPVVPIEAYWTYFRQDVRGWLEIGQNLLQMINIFAFIIYMVLKILEQMSEKERMRSLYEELSEANRLLEIYAEESIRNAKTKERNRLAREIHDTLGHALTGIFTGVEACILLMDDAPELAKQQMKAIAEVARKGIVDVRQSVKALRPDALENLPIETALQNMVDEMAQSTGVAIDYRLRTALSGFRQDEEEVVYRIFQESMTNAIRHGKASRIEIDVDRMDGGRLHIRVHDNGIGCGKVKEGFGLTHMSERVQLLDGDISYDGTDGFTLEAQIPIHWGNGD